MKGFGHNHEVSDHPPGSNVSSQKMWLTVNQTEPFPFRTKVSEFTHTKVVVSQQSPDDDVMAVEVFLSCNTTIKQRRTSNAQRRFWRGGKSQPRVKRLSKWTTTVRVTWLGSNVAHRTMGLVCGASITKPYRPNPSEQVLQVHWSTDDYSGNYPKESGSFPLPQQ